MVFPALLCYTAWEHSAQTASRGPNVITKNNSRKYFSRVGETDATANHLSEHRAEGMEPIGVLDLWQHHLQEHDRSAGTIKKYTQAIVRFLAWYEREERAPLQLSTLTLITLIGYRNELQHEQHKSTSTVNLQLSAFRSWCGWLTEQGSLAVDTAAHVKLVGGEATSLRTGLKSHRM